MAIPRDKLKDDSYITNLLKLMEFKLEDGKENTWSKKYDSSNNYKISIKINKSDLKESKIDYGKKIKVTRKTISTLNKPENFVVFECVNRLLDKGYKPESLILEKDWSLGHKGKGFLDILVLNKSNNSFLMIECKNFGDDFEKENKNMIEKGGQLFSYYIQEPDTEYLCLYASDVISDRLEYKNAIIKVQDNFKNKNQEEIHKVWNQIFEDNGIFEKDNKPYNITFKNIKKYQLKELNFDDGSFIFHRFEEILRKNIISDKTNAFNKIFNLFLCKIVDEDSKDDKDILEFQWGEDMGNKEVMLRLNDLYKKGMKDYLKINIADYTQQEINKILSNINKESVEKLKETIIELRLYTNNEFAFKEVFDKKTFDENCKIVKEIVQLLQRKRLKYSTKHQFLGDFFEKLLNTGIKQESGQFFTPVPLTRFICKSLPIKEIIERKNNNKETNFIPYVIDYASGSGHFLTEIMGEVNHYIEGISDDWIRGGKRARDLFNKGKNNFLWVEDYVYGIEKDYRLTKTSKVSCFLNGDGDANIFCADGLDNFHKSKEYNGLLISKKKGKDNPVFDIITANPPYAVRGFKNTLKCGEESFDLYNNLTHNSSEIECLFLERAKQLLKEEGVAGIIFPTTLLSKESKLHINSREILLKYFEIKGIVTLSNNAFMESGKNTTILFLKRINDIKHREIMKYIGEFFNNKKDITINSIQNPISKYVKFNYGFDLNDYISFIIKKPNNEVKKHILFKDYEEEFKNLKPEKIYKTILDIEKEKILYFILSYEKNVVMVNAPLDVREEKKFLGYEFSGRRGKEGIKIHKNSLLFDKDNLNNKEKINYYILENYKNGDMSKITEKVAKFLQVKKLHQIINFNDINFSKTLTVNLGVNGKERNWDKFDLKIKGLLEESKGTKKRVKDCISPINGTINKINSSDYQKKGNLAVISQDTALISGYIDDMNKSIKKENLPLIVFGDHSTVLKYVDFPFVCGADGVKLLRPKKEINAKIFYHLLRFVDKKEDQAYSRHFRYLKNTFIKIPKNQKKLLKEIEEIEKEKEKLEEQLEKLGLRDE